MAHILLTSSLQTPKICTFAGKILKPNKRKRTKNTSFFFYKIKYTKPAYIIKKA